jgi:NitT/TauT family transport system substrate-binding protein
MKKILSALLIGTYLLTGASSLQAAEKIVFATDWKAQAEHGGFYQALATGRYEKAGLDVEIRMGGPGIDNQQLMAAGAVDFAIGSNMFFALNLVQAGAPVTTVAAYFQKDPQILMTHPRDDINSIADMKGHPIMISDASVNTFWVWLKAQYGFADSEIRKYTFNMAPFLVDDKAIQQGYLSSEPKLVMDEGIEPEVYLLADAGWPSYSTMVLVPQEWIVSKPDVVQAFVDASIEGWYDYIYGDPAPVNILIKIDNPEMTDDTIAFGIAKMKEYGIVDSGDADSLGVGAMTDARWDSFFKVMAAAGIYPADMDYKAAYTLQFVNKKHAADMRK